MAAGAPLLPPHGPPLNATDPVAAIPDAPGQTAVDAGQPVEIGLAGGRSLKVWSSLLTAELRRLIRAVEGA